MAVPGWSEKIRQAIAQFGGTQAEFAQIVGVAPATLSRWVNGKNEPIPSKYVALANLVAEPDRSYFLDRAGIETYASSGEIARRQLRSIPLAQTDIQFIHRKKISRPLASGEKVVAIPLLSVHLYADETAPPQAVNLADAVVDDVLTAPLDWCPHPNAMVAMRVFGDSMFPTITPGALVVIDTSSNNRKKLDRKIVVVSHKDLGFKIARLHQIANAFLLVSANHRCMPIDVTNAAQWKLFGEVLWWITVDSALMKAQTG